MRDPRETESLSPPPGLAMKGNVQNLLDVAIVGCGPAGLVAAKSLLGKGFENIALFDESNTVGGLWNQESRPAVPCFAHDSNNGNRISINSSSQPVYTDLKANFPKDFTSFLGFPFDPQTSLFPDPTHVHRYYQEYVRSFGIMKHTYLATRVERCVKDDETDLWTIHTLCTKKDNDGDERGSVFRSKHLLVCNGHFRKAFCPDILGLSNFSGTLLHSSAFRSPSDYNNQTVLIVGGYISGSDICNLLTKLGSCRRIAVSIRKWKSVHSILLDALVKKHRVVTRPAIDHISEDGCVHFRAPAGKIQCYSQQVSETERPDVILFATGYRYYFPFLPSPPPNQPSPYTEGPDGFKMKRLYKRVLFVDDVTLAFIGTTNQNLSPAISMEYQARWYAHIVKHPSVLPDKETMEREVDSRMDDSTQDALMFKFPSYCNSLAMDVPGMRGYWTQLLLDRAPLVFHTLWVQQRSLVCWTAAVVVVIPIAVLAAWAIGRPTNSGPNLLP